jgi:hypothetical protein
MAIYRCGHSDGSITCQLCRPFVSLSPRAGPISDRQRWTLVSLLDEWDARYATLPRGAYADMAALVGISKREVEKVTNWYYKNRSAHRTRGRYGQGYSQRTKRSGNRTGTGDVRATSNTKDARSVSSRNGGRWPGSLDVALSYLRARSK